MPVRPAVLLEAGELLHLEILLAERAVDLIPGVPHDAEGALFLKANSIETQQEKRIFDGVFSTAAGCHIWRKVC